MRNNTKLRVKQISFKVDYEKYNIYPYIDALGSAQDLIALMLPAKLVLEKVINNKIKVEKSSCHNRMQNSSKIHLITFQGQHMNSI